MPSKLLKIFLSVALVLWALPSAAFADDSSSDSSLVGSDEESDPVEFEYSEDAFHGSSDSSSSLYSSDDPDDGVSTTAVPIPVIVALIEAAATVLSALITEYGEYSLDEAAAYSAIGILNSLQGYLGSDNALALWLIDTSASYYDDAYLSVGSLVSLLAYGYYPDTFSTVSSTANGDSRLFGGIDYSFVFDFGYSESGDWYFGNPLSCTAYCYRIFASMYYGEKPISYYAYAASSYSATIASRLYYNGHSAAYYLYLISSTSGSILDDFDDFIEDFYSYSASVSDALDTLVDQGSALSSFLSTGFDNIRSDIQDISIDAGDVSVSVDLSSVFDSDFYDVIDSYKIPFFSSGTYIDSFGDLAAVLGAFLVFAAADLVVYHVVSFDGDAYSFRFYNFSSTSYIVYFKGSSGSSAVTFSSTLGTASTNSIATYSSTVVSVDAPILSAFYSVGNGYRLSRFRDLTLDITLARLNYYFSDVPLSSFLDSLLTNAEDSISWLKVIAQLLSSEDVSDLVEAFSSSSLSSGDLALFSSASLLYHLDDDVHDLSDALSSIEDVVTPSSWTDELLSEGVQALAEAIALDSDDFELLSSVVAASWPLVEVLALADFFLLLDADPVAPSFTFQLPCFDFSGGQLIVSSYDLSVDLSPFDDIATLCRLLVLVAFIVGLISSLKNFLYFGGE